MVIYEEACRPLKHAPFNVYLANTEMFVVPQVPKRDAQTNVARGFLGQYWEQQTKKKAVPSALLGGMETYLAPLLWLMGAILLAVQAALVPQQGPQTNVLRAHHNVRVVNLGTV